MYCICGDRILFFVLTKCYNYFNKFETREVRENMYKVVIVDNYLDSEKVEIYEKEFETLEAAEVAYAGVFEQTKNLILEVLKLMLEIDKTQAPVLKQIIDVVNELELNEDIELNNREGRFLLVEKNCIEFSLAGKHIIAKVV